MSQALHDPTDIWFREILPSSWMSEADLERSVQIYLEKHIHDYHILLCKMDIESSSTRRTNRPDLVFIKKDYSKWFVVEVELSTHRFTHVREQVETFASGNYGDEHVKYLFSRYSDRLVEEDLDEMIKSRSPNVMVVVNDEIAKWETELKPLRCRIGIFQIYHDREGKSLYRLKGYFPRIKHDFAYCQLQSGMPLLILLLNKDFLDTHAISENDEIHCDYDGKISSWKRRDSKGKIYLECSDHTIPLDPLKKQYMLVRDEHTNSYYFNQG